jgi:chorismate synthase
VTRLEWRTAGESHGKTLIGVVEGVPAGLALDVERIDAELVRRQGGYGRGGRMKIERDHIEVLSGWKGGVTLGSPIAFEVPNRDQTIEDLPLPASPRPGHADLAGCQKYGHRDARAILERASARETAARVAAACIARQVIEAFGVEIFAHVVELGGVGVREDAWDAVGAGRGERRGESDFQCLDAEVEDRMRAAVDAAKEAGDTLGGVFEIRAMGLPPGLGEYSNPSERLTARLGGALFSIPAIKGVEVGLGFEVARRPGSEAHDAILPTSEGAWGGFTRETNRAGGLEGGMTTGAELVLRAAMKPIPTLRKSLPSVDFETREPSLATYQRSDVTSVPAASVVGEAVVALELTRAFLAKFGGDSMDAVRASWEAYRAAVAEV